MALGVSLAVLLLAVLATVAFDTGGAALPADHRRSPGSPTSASRFALGVDGIALVMLLLIGVLVPVVHRRLLATTSRRRAAAR